MRPGNPDNPLSAVVHIVDGYRGGRYGFPSVTQPTAGDWPHSSVSPSPSTADDDDAGVGDGDVLFADVPRRALFWRWLCGALLGTLTASRVYYLFQRKLRLLADRFKLTTEPAPWLALPVVVWGIELAVMLLVSLFVIL
jgi:undecaprenyl-diphosphatase